MTARPFTPQTLAEHWQVSPRKIQKMCREGVLESFAVGNMIRITQKAVEEYEQCNSPSEDCAAGSVYLGMKAERDGAISLKHSREKKQRARR